jgi:hypothetical protein
MLENIEASRIIQRDRNIQLSGISVGEGNDLPRFADKTFVRLDGTDEDAILGRRRQTSLKADNHCEQTNG